VVRGEMDVREVMIPCEETDVRSEEVVAVDWTDVRADGGASAEVGRLWVGLLLGGGGMVRGVYFGKKGRDF
jgi:hypothetical protein